jgi:hypothetical protein
MKYYCSNVNKLLFTSQVVSLISDHVSFSMVSCVMILCLIRMIMITKGLLVL